MGPAVEAGSVVVADDGTAVVAAPVTPVTGAVPGAGAWHLSTGGRLLWAPGGKLVAVAAPSGEDVVTSAGEVVVAAGEVVVAAGEVVVAAGEVVVVVAEGNVVTAPGVLNGPVRACPAKGTLQPGGSLDRQESGRPL